MLDWIGPLCIDMLGILCGSDSTISIVIIFTDESRNVDMIYSASASSHILRDTSGDRVDANHLPLWFP